jgi:hypothetical protein
MLEFSRGDADVDVDADADITIPFAWPRLYQCNLHYVSLSFPPAMI